MTAEHAMTFVNPTFHRGLNITVRHGDKWVQKARIGDTLVINGRKGRMTARITGMLLCMLDEIPQGILDLEHDAEARSHAGLKRILDGIYGPTGEGTRQVTVVFLVID